MNDDKNVNIYKLSPNGHRHVLNRVFINSIPIIVVMSAMAVYFSGILQGKQISHGFFPFLALVVISLFVGYFISFKQEMKNWNTYELTIDKNSRTISRRVGQYAEMSMCVDSIKLINEHPNGILIVYGNDPKNVILIPAQIDGRPDIVVFLKSVCGITLVKSKPRTILIQLAPIAGGIGIFLLVFGTNNKFLVVPSSVVLLVGTCWLVHYVRKSNFYDKKMKNMILVSLFPATAGIIKACGLFWGLM